MFRAKHTSSKHYHLACPQLLGVHGSDQRGQTDGFAEGYKNPQVLRRLVGPGQIQACLQHSQTLVALCRDLGWLVNIEKPELDPKQVFDFIGYQFDLKRRQSLTHPRMVPDTDNQKNY